MEYGGTSPFKSVQGVRGTTAPTLRGDFPSPADPPGQSLGLVRSLEERLAKGLFSRTLALTGIEPVPADATSSPLHRDAGRLRLSLDPSSRGRSRPLATRDQDFRVLDHDRRFGAGFDRREMSALPSGHPSTRADDSPWTPGGAA